MESQKFPLFYNRIDRGCEGLGLGFATCWLWDWEHVSKFPGSSVLLIFLHLLFICLYWGGAHATTCICICILEDNFQVLVLSFHHVVPRHQTWIIWVGGKYLYVLSCLTGLGAILFVYKIEIIEANYVGLFIN